jgi:hypothetical protein
MVASWFASQACMHVGWSVGLLGQPVWPGWGQHMLPLVDRRVACLLVRAKTETWRCLARRRLLAMEDQREGSKASSSGGVGKIFLD